jgi:NTE family protein
MPSEKNRKQLDIEAFKSHPEVVACVQQVQKLSKQVSDVLDSDGHQYVDLVQKGGGVLGIALVGYVYILEEANIRFLKLAGTSAGAINTSLMVIPGDKTRAKTDFLLKALIDLDLFKLVDGHPFARRLIMGFVKKPDFLKQMKKRAAASIGILVGLLLLCLMFLGLQHQYPLQAATCGLFILAGLYILGLGALFIYGASLLVRLKNSGFGINPGDFFYNWIKRNMVAKGINNTQDLIARAEITPPLLMRKPRQESTDDLKGKVVFIASELVTQNKFELPGMATLFRAKDKENEIHPAGFVRASMAIPVFFESFYVRDVPGDNDDLNLLWKEKFNLSAPPHTLRFVDGGILSNFPIDLFFNPSINKPRLPTFGIDLDDTDPSDKSGDADNWTFGGYLGRMFNTVRFYYDKDFRLKNRILEKGVGKVPVYKFNWLNFFLTDQQKIDLFVAGAQAAAHFLEEFDWTVYKGERISYAESQKSSK